MLQAADGGWARLNAKGRRFLIHFVDFPEKKQTFLLGIVASSTNTSPKTKANTNTNTNKIQDPEEEGSRSE